MPTVIAMSFVAAVGLVCWWVERMIARREKPRKTMAWKGASEALIVARESAALETVRRVTRGIEWLPHAHPDCTGRWSWVPEEFRIECWSCGATHHASGRNNALADWANKVDYLSLRAAHGMEARP